MISVSFAPPSTLEWIDWLRECQTEQEELNLKISNGVKSQAKSAVYGRLKERIYLDKQGPFFGKCAYCETFIYSTQHGDMEHFRPKGGVTNTDNEIIRLTDGTPHPGYYWLAYDFTNLRPACVLCNQPSTGRSQNVRIGKWNAFPLFDERQRAQKPGEESRESPLLINPTVDNPSLHLGLSNLTGVLFAVNASLRGQACIDIFGLNTRDLPSRRLERFRAINALFLQCMDKRIKGADACIETNKLKEVMRGQDEFCIAGRQAIVEGDRLVETMRRGLVSELDSSS